MIYLDQAATSFPKIKEVQDAVIDCMNHCTNANRSTSVTSLNASRLIYQTRKLIKEYFHVPQDGCVVLEIPKVSIHVLKVFSKKEIM